MLLPKQRVMLRRGWGKMTIKGRKRGRAVAFVALSVT